MRHFYINKQWCGIVVLLLFSLALQASAFYRGDEYEPRDFVVDPEYFIDLISILPRIEQVEQFERGTNAYIAAIGSYTRRDLFSFQKLKLQTGLEGPFAFTFDFQTGQDFDGIYDYYLLGVDYAFIPGWRAGLISQPIARKEFADFGFVLRHRSDRTTFDAMLLLPNFQMENKDDNDGHFSRQPVNVQARLWQDMGAPCTFFASVDADFPSETRYQSPEFDFQYESVKPRAGLIWRATTNQMLWGELAYERTTKSRFTMPATAPAPGSTEQEANWFALSRDPSKDFNTTRNYAEGRIEYIHWWNAQRYSLGCAIYRLRENNDYFNNPERSERYDHLSRIVYALWRYPMTHRFYFTSGLMLDFVNHRVDHEQRATSEYVSNNYEGKIPFAIEWATDRFSVTGGVSVQADQSAFGGGYVNAVISF